MPKVSVIIPAYNQAHFLGNAIESVLNQSYRNYEIIVVDDGSVDNTRQVAARYQGYIRYIWQENKGLAGARNTGIRAAMGDLIGLLDSDDEWMPAYLEKMAHLADQNPQAVVYYCAAQGVDTEGNLLPQIFGGLVLPSDALYHALVRANFLIPSTILMRTQAVREAGYFDEQLRSCEDWDLWLRLLPAQTFVGTDELLVRYRIHGSSLSTDPAGMQNAARAVIEKHFGKDDGNPEKWSALKRRAFGGLYFYHAWTSILRKGDWEAAGDYIYKALLADGELVSHLDFYYEILLGRQPVGFRGSAQFLSLEDNVSALEEKLCRIKTSEISSGASIDVRKMFGFAYYAAGLLAYNTHNLGLSRKYILLALRCWPGLWRERRLLNLLLRSLLPRPVFQTVKRAKSIFFR